MRILALLICFFVIACGGGDDTPKSPESSLLSYPEKNSECTTGVSISETVSEVEFRWLSSANTDIYELQVTNLSSGTSQTINTSSLSSKVPLEKGTPFSWKVISKNTGATTNATSETWSFYNAGYITSFAPFPAEITAPKIGDNAFIDINNEVTLKWSGADLDNDIESYDLYFGTENPPTTLLETISSRTTEYKVTATTDTIYYWKIITKDQEENTSDTGVYSFRAL